MSWKDMDEKGVLRRGCFLIFFAALMVLAVLRFEQVWGALATLLNTLAPVFGGMAVAYVLNVFVHFFEDIAFKPFAKSKSKLWAQAKRPVAVALAYIVVLLVGLFVCFFIIPGLAESVSGLAVYLQQNAPAIVNQAVAWANAFARENDLTFVTEFLDNLLFLLLVQPVHRGNQGNRGVFKHFLHQGRNIHGEILRNGTRLSGSHRRSMPGFLEG